MVVVQPSDRTPADICLGRGEGFWSHPGNVALRQSVIRLFPKWRNGTTDDRTRIEQDVVDAVVANNGRFLLSRNRGKTWCVLKLEDRRVKNKVMVLFEKQDRAARRNNNAKANDDNGLVRHRNTATLVPVDEMATDNNKTAFFQALKEEVGLPPRKTTSSSLKEDARKLPPAVAHKTNDEMVESVIEADVQNRGRQSKKDVPKKKKHERGVVDGFDQGEPLQKRANKKVQPPAEGPTPMAIATPATVTLTMEQILQVVRADRASMRQMVREEFVAVMDGLVVQDAADRRLDGRAAAAGQTP